MKRRDFFSIFSLLLTITILASCFLVSNTNAASTPDVYVGINLAYGDVADAKALIDQVRSYTNFFIISTRQITSYITRVDEICQYLYDRNMYFSIYYDHRPSNQLLNLFRTKWFGHFVGFYAFDEVGGRQLDQIDYHITVTSAIDDTDAAKQFTTITKDHLRTDLTPFQYTANFVNSTEFPLFTSDYALYWFDYKAGYDTIWAHLGWNHSRQLNIALCRGAATVLNKEWGVMSVWTYTKPPYLQSGHKLYDDMVLAYRNGAKYITVFNSNEQYTQGILQPEHLDAIRQFWQYTQNYPKIIKTAVDRVAFVLPKDYAFGFRGPKDKIWGLWEATDFSNTLWVNVNNLLQQYGDKLDIIYDDGLQLGNNGYSKLIYWNDTTLNPSSTPNPWESRIPTPTHMRALNKQPLPISYLYAIVSSGIITAAIVAIAVAYRNRKRTSYTR